MDDQMPFTPGMREVLKLAKAEAGRLECDYLGPEHYLLGMIRKADGLGFQTLHNLGIDLVELKIYVEKKINPGQISLAGEFAPNNKAKIVMEKSRSIALQMSHGWMGTEHLLIALASVEHTIPYDAFHDSQLDADRITSEVLNVIEGSQPEKKQAAATKEEKPKMNSGKISAADSILSVVDIQEKFAPHIFQWNTMLAGTKKLVQAASMLGVPVVTTEQYPKGLGNTVADLKNMIPDFDPIEKTAFGCFGETLYDEIIRARKRSTIVLCGIETHVCVLQTALEGLAKNYRIVIAADASSSRLETEKNLRSTACFRQA